MRKFQNKVIIITGPTASGKSELAINLAKQINGVIINADSVQVYKEAPILTSSPTKRDMKLINHFLYNFITLDYKFKVTEWLKLVTKLIDKTLLEKKTPILVGGSGFYISTLINGLSEIPEIIKENIEKAEYKLNSLGIDKFKIEVAKIDKEFTNKFTDPYRLLKAYSIFLQTNIPLSIWQKKPKKKFLNQNYILFKILPNRENLYKKIDCRFNTMVKSGALEEAEKIINSSYINKQHYKKIIGLSELIDYLNKQTTLDEALALASQKTRNYAKRQITWIKNQLNKGIIINDILKVNIKELII